MIIYKYLLVAVALVATVSLQAFAATAPAVQVATASERPIVQVVRVNGTVTSPRSAVLSSSVSGLIETMRVDAGDRVAAGDLAVALDTELESLALERIEAELAQAQTALADARRRFAEAESVGAERGIAETEIKSRRAEVEREQAAVRARETAVRQQRAVVRRHQVLAPFDGVVTRRLAEVGEWANPGDGLVELVATDGLRFDFRVPQEYFGSIVPGTRIDLESDAVSGYRGTGQIRAIVPVKDPGARTFLLRVVADGGTGGKITPGMSARGVIHIERGRSGIVVSRDALLRYPDGREVVWVVEDGAEPPVVREQRVQTGLQFDGLVEITGGLAPDAVVVTRGNEALQDGQAVRVQ